MLDEVVSSLLANRMVATAWCWKVKVVDEARRNVLERPRKKPAEELDMAVNEPYTFSTLFLVFMTPKFDCVCTKHLTLLGLSFPFQATLSVSCLTYPVLANRDLDSYQ